MSNQTPTTSQVIEPKKEEFNAKKYVKNGLTEEDIVEIKEAFDLFDADKSGQIDIEELRQALKNLGIETKNQTLQKMIADLDTDKSGKISFEEFFEMMGAKINSDV